MLLTPYDGAMGSVFAGAVRQGHACDLNVHWDNFPRVDDLSRQLAQLEQMSGQRSQAIAITPIQIEALRNPVQRTSSGGVPVIVIGEDLGIRNSNIAYVLTDEHLAGKLAADRIAQVLDGVGTVAVTGLDFAKPSSVQRDQAFEQELADHFSKIRVVARRSGTTNLFQEQKTVDDLLNRFAHLDAIVGLNASSTRGAFYALKARDVHPLVHLVGFDQDLFGPLAHGEFDGMIAPPAAEIGKTVAQLVCDRLAGRNWAGPYVLSPMLLTSETVRQKNSRERVFGGVWWDGEE